MKNLIIGIIFVTLSANITFFFILRRNPVDSENASREKKIEAMMLKQFEVEHRSLILSSNLIDSIQKYQNNSILFIFYFNNHSCGSCVDNAIADLISYKETIGKQHILIIVSEDNEKSAKLMMNNVKDYFNTIWIKNNELKFEGIEENLPIHFFLLDQTMMPFCLYFYMPEFSALNRKYFNIVAKKILQNDTRSKELFN